MELKENKETRALEDLSKEELMELVRRLQKKEEERGCIISFYQRENEKMNKKIELIKGLLEI